MTGPSPIPSAVEPSAVSWHPRQLVIARLQRVNSFFGDTGPSLPREVWDFLPKVVPDFCKLISDTRPHVFRMKPIPSFGTEDGVYLYRKRRTEWGNRYFEVKFLSSPRRQEAVTREMFAFVRALGESLGNGASRQQQHGVGGGSTTEEAEGGEGDEGEVSDEGSYLSESEDFDDSWDSSDSEYSWGRSTESRERHPEFIETICSCEGSYNLGIVVGRNDFYFTVDEDKCHLHYRKLSGGVFVDRSLELPETIEELSYADGHIFVVGKSRRLYMLKSDRSGWRPSLTLPGSWCPFNSYRFQDAVVVGDQITKVLYVHQGGSIRDGTDLCVWEENEDIRRIKGLEVCAVRFLPYTDQQVVAGIFQRDRMKPPSHIETFGVMDVATGAFLAEANSDRDDFLFNYPGGKVMSLSIDRGSWKAVMIGYDQKCGYETVDFPSRYVWEVGYGTLAHEADSQ